MQVMIQMCAEMQAGFFVKCPLFLFEITQNWKGLIFSELDENQMFQKSVQWFRHFYCVTANNQT
jgi:hypothetical protein